MRDEIRKKHDEMIELCGQFVDEETLNEAFREIVKLNPTAEEVQEILDEIGEELALVEFELMEL